jgi:hypothetical protein
MDSTEFPKGTALVTLLNEIEMLLNELRSMESHVRGAQALTAERIAQLQAEHQRELATLRSALLSRGQAKDIQQYAREAQSEAQQPLDPVSQQAGSDPAGKGAMGSGEAEIELRQALMALDQLQQENTALRCRLAEHEVLGEGVERRTVDQLEEMRLRYEGELGELRSILALRDRMLEEQQIFAHENERRLRGTLLDAQREIEQKDRLFQKAAGAEIAMKPKEKFPNEELVAMKTGERDPDSPGAARGDDKAASPSEADQNLRDEIERLRQEAQERNQILQDRNDELVRVKLQLDQLQERMAQLESSMPEESAADSQERMRTEFQAQVALLQAELSQKEWALEERQAGACSRELELRQQITALRKQLISNHREREQRDLSLGEGGNDSAHGDFSPIGGEGESAHGTFAAQRRWNSGLGRKRRWRS